MRLKCVCTDKTFTELLRCARAAGLDSAAALGARTGAGTKCGMCRPLLEDMLAKGEVNVAGIVIKFPEPVVENAQQRP